MHVGQQVVEICVTAVKEGNVKIKTKEPCYMQKGSTFVLRNENSTIGTGKILKCKVPRE